MVLKNKEKLTNQIFSCINKSQNFVCTLIRVIPERQQLLQWFQELCEYLIKIINTIGMVNREIEPKLDQSVRDTIILYLVQSITTLSLLTRIFIEEENLHLILLEARKSVKKQLEFCLEGIRNTFISGAICQNPSGTFVRWMDDSLAIISEIDVSDKVRAKKLCDETRQLFEEVLCHAMSIAQVSLNQDCKIIRGSCQTVLESLTSLAQEVENINPNPAMVNLCIESCSNKLCSLEKKVNTAVLKLCLTTFSQFSTPLKKLHNFCFDKENRGRRAQFDNLVVDFDLHVDRIMQIGLFAVSCSSDVARGTKIRSCLASLEALESELVPVFTAALMDNSVHNTHCASILEQHWLSQATCLQQLIYLIIDPFAFCQIIHEEAKEIVENLSYLVKHKRMKLKSSDIENLLNIANVLETFLENARKEFDNSELSKIDLRLPDFHKIVGEVGTASSMLGNDNFVDGDVRTLKRCKILLTVIKRIWHCFAEGVLEGKIVDDNNKDKTTQQLSSEVENLRMEPFGNPFLDHIINRGRQILEERSILYRTPKKANTLTLPKPNTAKFTERRGFSARPARTINFINNRVKDHTTLESHISSILREITNLSTTYNNV